MGEVIGAAIVLIAVVILVGGGITVVVRQTRPDPNAIESPQYRNHLAMARWIEAILRDDMVACTIRAEEQERARTLLSTFYDEKPGKLAK